ncbi:MAG: PaaI family thioesterase [Eggerthellaceae bacterium]|jgi:1,4-dihydroxy-2-naphthoyl-CoA hydrolase
MPLEIKSVEKTDVTKGLTGKLGIVFTKEEPECVEADMPLDPTLYQPFGFVHGGATISLLETVASRAAELSVDFSKERPFGIEVHVRHWKSAQKGVLHGRATLDHMEGPKQYWAVVATDDEGDVISQGTIVTKVVTLERLREKEAKRAAKRAKAAE